MMKYISPLGNQSITILKKPVVAISEDDKNVIKAPIDKWATQAKAQKVNKPTRYIAERDKLLVEWLFNTGMRISDALAINYRDIEITKEEVTFMYRNVQRRNLFFIPYPWTSLSFLKSKDSKTCFF